MDYRRGSFTGNKPFGGIGGVVGDSHTAQSHPSGVTLLEVHYDMIDDLPSFQPSGANSTIAPSESTISEQSCRQRAGAGAGAVKGSFVTNLMVRKPFSYAAYNTYL